MRLILSAILLTVLTDCLEVKANDSRGYNLREWLPRWSDSDGDCQSTRHELLIRYSLAPVTFTNESGCIVETGLWLDPYTGQFFRLASDLDVEHIVPLSWAHKHGGSEWTVELKRKFSEDPENLWLVDDGRNQSKGDKGPNRWLPPYEPVQSIYIQRFLAIVKKYDLQINKAEYDQILAQLEN
ncbi:DUF1524 domain-containing protein [Microbulbifer sp. VAAF005]|uniref:GmrSD restriction endonuclease domain-containing protein n=1 Tax=Microbulbifer sp. VAAF005 TaxID=3034230 RepID=UPI0024AE2975|nr:DUF1524 domain-containing protein [Microbulbifer sp. VAAF005]WHI44623.1 DUF1524 domain-containing protein [Microbulbifer sp. VAAF005]